VDQSGQSSTAAVDVIVDGSQAIGAFSLTFLDLSVPVAGLPIEVTRTYDSRDKGQGDFGFGWRLGLTSLRLQENATIGTGWQGTTSSDEFPVLCVEATRAHIVSVRLPDGT